MNEFCNEAAEPETGPDFEPAYNRHYITTDAEGRIASGWSDGPHPERDTTDAICINEQGGYQFRLIYSVGFVGDDAEFPTFQSEENPSLDTEDGIPLYIWGNGVAIKRTEAEIDSDRLPLLKVAKLAQLSAACNAAITAGCDVVLSDSSTGHISLTAEDQINLTNAAAAVESGAEAYPYHLDGQLCALYTAADILAMARAATAHKLYHTTYYNHLAELVRHSGTKEVLDSITYGVPLPADLAKNMAAILAAAGGENDAL